MKIIIVVDFPAQDLQLGKTGTFFVG